MLSLQYLNENMLFRGNMALRGPGAMQGGDDKEVQEVVLEEQRHGFSRLAASHVRKRKRDFIAKTSLTKTKDAVVQRINAQPSANQHQTNAMPRPKLVKDGVSEYCYWFGEFAFVVKEQDFWIVHTELDVWCDWLKNPEVRDVDGTLNEELRTRLMDEPKCEFQLHPSGDMIAFICCADIFVIPLHTVRHELCQKVVAVNKRMEKLLSDQKRVKMDTGGEGASPNEIVLQNPTLIYKVTRKEHSEQLNGIADYVMSEEFNRQTGYWWRPNRKILKNGDIEYNIAYLNVDETHVPMIRIPQEGMSFDFETYRYPLCGEKNPLSTLCSVTFSHNFTQPPRILQLKDLFLEYLPWVEYIPTLGWLSNGERMWMQVLDRRQQRYAFMLVDPTDCSRFNILKEIRRPNGWVNVIHEVHSFKRDPSLLILTLQDPHTHIYLFSLNPNYSLNTVRQLTQGTWDIIHDNPLCVDENRDVVYFKANHTDLLEHHLYGVSFARGLHSKPVRLTPRGHTVHEFHFNNDCSKFVVTYSSASEVPQCITYEAQEYAGAGHVPHFVPILQYKYSAPSIKTLFPYPVIEPEIFSFETEGDTLIGAVYKPVNYDPKKSYPCIVSSYSGPNFAVVHRSFALTSNGRNQLFANRGFCVVLIDGRGSAHRGYNFEMCFKDRLCQFEYEDNVTAVNFIKNTTDFRIHVNLDMTRVGIFGFSYGGSVALHALSRRGDFFRSAACVSPVIMWQYYSSAYTERYMGFPEENEESYLKSCGLHCVKHLPDEDGRLLLCHGMSDSNVFFKHTELLLEQMNEYCKPYRLAIYPGCSHSISQGVRHLTINLLNFFEQSLKAP